ncbi:MAG TPA: VWA domain-containing protein, partial [Bryobacteraceae bacterium]|nr:VWA domain-containing protein [Bryobacteraceae bacterium]
MKRTWLALATCACLLAQDEVVFRTDTTLVRVDVQVLDESDHAISKLEKEAFVLREQGKTREIRNFAREEMPLDLLFLIDVSGSMRPHVERVANAAKQTLPSMRKDDRAAIMVFDRETRLQMPFMPDPQNALKEFDNLLRHETFRGGTDITAGLL